MRAKIITAAFLGLIAGAALTARQAGAQSGPAAEATAARWEYKRGNGLNEAEMNKLGDEGWELTTSSSTGAGSREHWLKRRK